MPTWLYYLLVVALFLSNSTAWGATLVALPGNWIIVGLTALFAWLVEAEQGQGVEWITIAVLAGLALAGELIEFAAGAAGAARVGASRRAVILSIAGAVVGSLAGMLAGLPVPLPLIGPLISAVGGGAIGAFAGAYIGEHWKGREHPNRMAVGRGAFFGRLWGTVGKLGVGAIMLVIATADSLM